MPTGHFFEYHVTWATPTTIFAIYSVGLFVFQRIFRDHLAEWGFAMSDHELVVDEDLPNFFKAVKLSQADEIIAENKNMMENYGFEPNDPDTIETLDATVVPKKAIQGTPWYQILSNPLYEDAFNYLGAFVPEREKLIEDGYPEEHVGGKKKGKITDACKRARYEQSDMVMILLNLAYIPDEVVKKINFKPGWQKVFKQNMDEFKAHFKQTHGRKWTFQTHWLEEEYLAFVYMQEKSDPNVQEPKQADLQEKKYQSFFDSIEAFRNRKNNQAKSAAGTSIN